MPSLTKLRILTAIFFLVFIGQELMVSLYDPSLSSPILLQARAILEGLLKNSVMYNVLGALAIIALSYSLAALWFGYNSGKWFYILFLIFEIVIQCLTPVIAYSGVTSALNSLYFLLLGVILAMLYTSPFKAMFFETKPFKVWRVIGMFLVFLVLIIIPAVIAFYIAK